MSKFVSIYQEVVRRRSLRDDIPVSELPKTVREEIVVQENHKEVISKMRKNDTEIAKQRLLKIMEQLKKKE